MLPAVTGQTRWLARRREAHHRLDDDEESRRLARDRPGCCLRHGPLFMMRVSDEGGGCPSIAEPSDRLWGTACGEAGPPTADEPA